MMRFRTILALFVLFLTTTLIATANININLINNTAKPLQFVVSEPEGSTSTDAYTVNANTNYNFSLDDVIAKGCERHQLCHKNKFWVVLEKWGNGIVYLRCPKMFNASSSNASVNLKVGGDDTSDLYCWMERAKPHQS